MPLKKGKSQKTIEANIATEIEVYKRTGRIGGNKPKSEEQAHKQAVAIALAKAREKTR